MGKRLANPCNCGRLHLWADGQPFKQSDETYDSYATVVMDDGLGPVSPGILLSYESIGNRTSNESEYSAVIIALEWALNQHERVHVITDSDLILGHLEKGYRCTLHLRPYRDRVSELLAQTGAVLEWQGRDANRSGWHNAGVLLERARAKAKRARESREERR